MKKLSEINALVVDNGLFVELAVRLAQDYKSVRYYVPWESAFPKMNNAWVGRGLPGIEVVDSIFGPHFDDIDLFIFPDVYFGHLQCYLEAQGKTVWGGRLGEELELDRGATKELMKTLGLPVNPWRRLKGMVALRDYLKGNKDKWVKIDKFRGTFETFHAKDYRAVEPKLDEVEHGLGAFKNVVEFIVEDPLPDCVEIGMDAYSIDGRYPEHLLSGIEIKDLGFAGVFKGYKEFPEPLRRYNDAIAPTLKAYGYRGFMSSEVRIDAHKKGVMIDACQRAASPPNELYQEFYLNIGEIIWKGANGIMVDPRPVSKFGAEIMIHSSWADKNWQPVDVPKNMRRFVKLRNATIIEGRQYVIPQAVGLPEIGAVIGYGATLKEAMQMASEVAEAVTGYYINIPCEALDKAQEQVEMCEKFGLKVF